jgi:hypothetical protein
MPGNLQTCSIGRASEQLTTKIVLSTVTSRPGSSRKRKSAEGRVRPQADHRQLAIGAVDNDLEGLSDA